MHGCLFVAHEHMAQARLRVQRIVQGQHGAARVAEDGVDAQGQQGVDQGTGAVARRKVVGGSEEGSGIGFHVSIFCLHWQKRLLVFSYKMP
ncbi:hypothetical protein D3C81_1445770 [compost metagenome]